MAKEKDKTSRAVVIGAGIAGIKTALELAEFGIKVQLCDHRPYIGGALSQLDRWFPDNHCGMCKVLPVFNRDSSSQYCLRRGLVHPNIEVLPDTGISKVEGKAGDFRVTLGTEPSLVNAGLCIGCGLCLDACPVEVESEYGLGQEKRKAIYLRHPLAIPKTFTIDREHCTRCGACVEVCPAGAIDLSAPETEREVEAGAIVLSTGFETFDPLAASQYGYQRYPNVVTSIELERMLSGGGPTGGRLLRPSDGEVPASIAFLQCVGSRDMKRNYCSAACCMYALKEAMIIREEYPEAAVSIFYMDLRAFGKGYHRYYERAREEMGIDFVRCRVPVVKQDFLTGDLLLSMAEGTGSIETERFGLVVLSVGQTPSPRFAAVAGILGLETNRWDFCNTEALSPVVTNREGIYICGSASGPKDIADTLTEASAAAGRVASLLAPVRKAPAATEPAAVAEEPKVVVVVCGCRGQMADTVDVKELAEFSRGLPGVVSVAEADDLCRPEVWQDLPTKLKESGADRVVLAACTALRPHELIGDVPVELVNIREELAWVHGDSSAAMAKGKRQLAMAVERSKGRENSPTPAAAVTPRAVVVGAGLGGLVAALSVAEYGFEVDLIEKSDRPGGNVNHIHSLLEGGDPQAYLQQLVAQVEASPLITLRMGTELVQVQGYAGNFSCVLQGGKEESQTVSAGVVIAAAGAEEARPTEYLYGQEDMVVTQRELEERLASGEIKPQDLKSVAMIQCVGSRDEERPYCSRICCSQALKNALELRRGNPEVEIVVFYRDLMSYGFKEEFYTKAREEGVLFVQYDLNSKPEVTAAGDGLELRADEPVLGKGMVMKPDLVVLSPGVVAGGNRDLAGMLGLELTADGFFQEAEVKFRPVDTLREGMFICGLAHSPRGMAETVVQAQAAAQRAVRLLMPAGLTAGRVVSQVNARRCSGCELCIAACPYNARVKDPVQGVAVVLEALCQGCGACVVACPNSAASLREFGDRQIFSMMDVAL